MLFVFCTFFFFFFFLAICLFSVLFMLRLLCLRARRASDGTWRGQVFLSSDKVSEVMARCFALHGTYHGDGVGAVVSTELCVASVQGGRFAHVVLHVNRGILLYF